MTTEEFELLRSLERENAALKRETTDSKKEAQDFKEQAGRFERKVDQLQEQLDALLQRLYGRRSERFVDPNQRDLFEEYLTLTDDSAVEPVAEELEQIEYKRHKPKKRGPKPLPEHLPRIEERVDPPANERVCACCTKDMECVDEVVTEELDIVPPQFRVKRLVQGKWRCRECMNRDLVEPLPARPIERGRPSPSLLAYIVVSKYADHVPVYRQEQIFHRSGIQLVRSTMDGWLGAMSGLLLPIVSAMKRSLLLEKFLQSDDTRIQVQDRSLKGKTQRCYIWAYCRPDGEIVYHFTETRSAKGPLGFLKTFSGDLQSDGFSGYKPLWSTGRVRHIACLAHIRRKFFEGRKSAPEKVEAILEKIRQAYKVEESARKTLGADELLEVRETQVRPILDATKVLICELSEMVLPKSKLGLAVGYALEEWPALLRYLEVPDARLDNNSCYAARGITAIMPTARLCRVDGQGHQKARDQAVSRVVHAA